MKWLAIKLKNLQSWEDNILQLNNKGLTVLEAKSETGKSVFIKALKLGVNYMEYRPDVRKSIVRNWSQWKSAEDNASLTIVLEDKSVVIFSFSPTSVSTKYVDTEGKATLYSGPAPKHIVEKLNLVQCKGSTRIINIIDNENKILFDTSDNTYNNNILDVFLKHQELENRRRNSESSLALVKNAITAKSNQIAHLDSRIISLPKPVNIDLAEEIVDNLTRLCRSITFYESLIECLNNINKLSSYKVIDETELKNILDSLKYKSEIVNKLNKIVYSEDVGVFEEIGELTKISEYLRIREVIVSCLNNILKIEKPNVINNIEVLSEKIIKIKNNVKLFRPASELNNILKEPEPLVLSNTDISNKLKHISELSNLIQTMSSLSSLQEKIDDIQIVDMSNKDLDSLNSLLNLSKVILNIQDTFEFLDSLSSQQEELSNILEEYKKTHDFCPTCRQEIKEVQL